MRAAIVLLLALSACATDPLAKFNGQPITCNSFATQGEAQEFLEQQPEHHWTLDPKQSGRACTSRWPA